MQLRAFVKSIQEDATASSHRRSQYVFPTLDLHSQTSWQVTTRVLFTCSNNSDSDVSRTRIRAVNVSLRRACSNLQRNLQHYVAWSLSEQVCARNEPNTENSNDFTAVKWPSKVSLQIVQYPCSKFSEKKSVAQLDFNFVMQQKSFGSTPDLQRYALGL